MNTAKQVNVMIGLLFVALIGGLLYFLWDDTRAEEATDRQMLEDAERGGKLYSLNCRSCHGLKGLGAAERAGLPGLPLNLDANRSPELSGGALEAKQKRFHETITCGRIGTVMPPWLTDNGGALNFYQIEQLVTLITSDFSLEGWEYAIEQANHGDEFLPAKHLAAAVSATDTTIRLDSIEGIKASTEESPVLIRLGGESLDDEYEILRVVAISEFAHTLQVERGPSATGTKAIEHPEGTEVFQGPIAPGTTITGDPKALGDPPCGQRPAAPASTAAPGEAIALADGSAISMGDSFFELDGAQNPALALTAGATVTVKLTNGGKAIHNLRVAGPDGQYNTDDDIVSDPNTIPAGGEAEIVVSIATAGTYNYQCDFHAADMKGTITVQ